MVSLSYDFRFAKRGVSDSCSRPGVSGGGRWSLDDFTAGVPSLVLIGGLIALVVLASYTIKRRLHTVLAANLCVIAVFVFMAVAAYRIRIAQHHERMTEILRNTAAAIRAGKSNEVMDAYDRYATNRTGSLWNDTAELYENLIKIAGKTNLIQDGAANGSLPIAH